MTTGLTDQFTSVAMASPFVEPDRLCQREVVFDLLRPLAGQSTEALKAFEWLRQKGGKVLFAALPDGCSGYYDGGKPPKIVLSDEYLDLKKLQTAECLATLVHETRHAWQEANTKINYHETPSYFEMQYGKRHDLYAMCLREADAFAHDQWVEAELSGKALNRTIFMQEAFIDWFEAGYEQYAEHYKECFDILIEMEINRLSYGKGWDTPEGEAYAQVMKRQAYREPSRTIGAEEIKALGEGFTGETSYINDKFARTISNFLAKYTKDFELDRETHTKITTYTNLLPPAIKGR